MSLALPALILILVACATYRWCLQQSTIPNAHFSSSVSNFWILYERWREHENRSVYAAHRRLGPVIRLAANEVSVNSPEGLEAIYTGNFDKHDFYSGMENFDQTNIFSELKKKSHLEKRKVLSTVYSKSYVMASLELRAILHQVIYKTTIDKLRQHAQAKESVEIWSFASSLAMDMISRYIFGLDAGTDFLNDETTRAEWQGATQQLTPYLFLWLELRRPILFLEKFGRATLPQGMLDEADKQPAMTIALCQRCASLPSPSSHATVYSKLAAHLAPSTSTLDFTSTTTLSRPSALLASEVHDHLLAGSDTTATTLTYILYELALRPALQSLLRNHLATLPPAISTDVPEEVSQPYLAALDRLPLLNAIMTETLRLYPAVPGCQARVVPAQGTTIHGHFVPAGTRISCSAYSLHRNEKAFPEPGEWRYERWLEADEAQRREMERWFWGWGSGVRMCIGKPFATVEMKVLVAEVVRGFWVKVVDDQGVGMGDGYFAGPRGKVVLGFEEVEGD